MLKKSKIIGLLTLLCVACIVYYAATMSSNEGKASDLLVESVCNESTFKALRTYNSALKAEICKQGGAEILGNIERLDSAEALLKSKIDAAKSVISQSVSDKSAVAIDQIDFISLQKAKAALKSVSLSIMDAQSDSVEKEFVSAICSGSSETSEDINYIAMCIYDDELNMLLATNTVLKSLMSQQSAIAQSEDAVAEQSEVWVLNGTSKPLYTKFNNKLTLVVSGSEIPSDYRLGMDGGTLKIDADGDYIAVCDAGATKAKIYLYNSNGEMVKGYKYDIVDLPQPTAALNYTATNGNSALYYGNTPMFKEEILSISEVCLEMDSNVDTGESVVGFDLTIIGADGVVSVQSSNSATLTESQIEMLSSVAKGDKILFNNIIVKSNYGEPRELSPINVMSIIK